eukprot:NODE_2213_length_1112_cov_71.651777_g2195_i0.p1 GENE.NODE_2213_length_1112_cov_71.651777_g2195_i0~~NODE_2213_length_1112_cov_71.651777_g2195_i0.p1  ORF type:complete len:346 (+),score=94.90 NODE_2213_length_1112_cov_71.651777_g2195_i0:64-1038(+)
MACCCCSWIIGLIAYGVFAFVTGGFSPGVVVESYLVLGRVLFYCFRGLFRFFMPTKKSLKGETVVITGGGMGIGRLMALDFAKKGSTVFLIDLNLEAAEAVKGEITKAGGKAHAFKCDISDRKAVYAVADQIKKIADVSVLVNNAGIVTGKKFLDCPDELMIKTMEVNTNAHFWTTKAFLPTMIEKNHGHVVTIASSAGMTGVAGLVDYCASKFGAFGFDESLRLEMKKLGKDGVHTTCVAPYFIDTGMFKGAKTRFPALLPILTPEYAASKIMEAVETNTALLCMPRMVYLIPLLRMLPCDATDAFAKFLGVSNAMDDFKGRQ